MAAGILSYCLGGKLFTLKPQAEAPGSREHYQLRELWVMSKSLVKGCEFLARFFFSLPERLLCLSAEICAVV